MWKPSTITVFWIIFLWGKRTSMGFPDRSVSLQGKARKLRGILATPCQFLARQIGSPSDLKNGGSKQQELAEDSVLGQQDSGLGLNWTNNGTHLVVKFDIWRFPWIGVPLNHPFGISLINHPAIGVPPWLWKPPCMGTFNVGSVDSHSVFMTSIQEHANQHCFLAGYLRATMYSWSNHQGITTYSYCAGYVLTWMIHMGLKLLYTPQISPVMVRFNRDHEDSWS